LEKHTRTLCFLQKHNRKQKSKKIRQDYQTLPGKKETRIGLEIRRGKPRDPNGVGEKRKKRPSQKKSVWKGKENNATRGEHRGEKVSHWTRRRGG